MQLQNLSSTFRHKNKSILSATCNTSCPPMAYNTAGSLDQLTCISTMGSSEKVMKVFDTFLGPKMIPISWM